MNKANISSFKIKMKVWIGKTNDSKRSNRNDFRHAELSNLKKQYEIDKSIIPALRRNYDTSIIAWQNNMEICLWYWMLGSIEYGSNRKTRQAGIEHPVAIEKQLETK
jgi:hypothetical protein